LGQDALEAVLHLLQLCDLLAQGRRYLGLD